MTSTVEKEKNVHLLKTKVIRTKRERRLVHTGEAGGAGGARGVRAGSASGIVTRPRESTYRQEAQSGLKDTRFSILKSV